MSRLLNAIIVDDEKNARENLRLLVEDFCQDIHVLQVAANATEAHQLVEELNPDLVFLDIMMPGEDGFSFLSKYPDRQFAVIFTTAHNDFALKAIKVSAIDYLEKPINIEELQQAATKAHDQLELLRNADLSDERLKRIFESYGGSRSSEKTAIPTRDGMAIVKNSDIIHLEANESYTTIYLTDGRKYLSSKTIKTYEAKLSDMTFMRVHKSHIINITDHLREFTRTGGNVAILSNEVEIPISRRKLPMFLDRIANL
jgi:two-component system, LytTR family, response regulator